MCGSQYNFSLIHVQTHTSMPGNKQKHNLTHKYIHMHTCKHACMHTSVPACTHTCTQTHTYTFSFHFFLTSMNHCLLAVLAFRLMPNPSLATLDWMMGYNCFILWEHIIIHNGQLVLCIFLSAGLSMTADNTSAAPLEDGASEQFQ